MLRIAQADYKFIAEHGEHSFPNECCGFFFGEESANGEQRIVKLVQTTPNVKEGDQRKRFQISPLAYMKAERYALDNDLTLLGVYHTHPDHPAIPSEHDLAVALPYFSYIILSVNNAKSDTMRVWRLDENETAEKRFVEEGLTVSDAVTLSPAS